MSQTAVGPTLVCCFSTNQGGMELMSFDLTNLLAPLGEVHLVSRAGSFIHKEAKNHGVKSVVGISFTGNFSFKMIREFKALIREKKIKNIIFLGASELRSLYFACKDEQINFINFHGTTKTHSKKDLLHKIVYQIVNTHVTVSDHIQKNIRKILPIAPHTKIKTIYTPKDIKSDFIRKPRGTFKCVLVARIVQGKGHLDAIEACIYALDQGYDVELKFVGNVEDKKLFKTLEKKIANSPMKGRCHFMGHQQDVAPFYKEAHILLFPSLGEGLPAVLLEAFQYGVLPVTYDNTVFPEFLKMGFKFVQAPNKSVSQLKALFVDALKNYNELDMQLEENYNLSKELFSADHIRKEYALILKKPDEVEFKEVLPYKIYSNESTLRSKNQYYKPRLSLFIAFYNNIPFLKNVWASLETQTFKDFEVIICDDGSRSDVVNHIHEGMKKTSVLIKHIWHEDRGFRKNEMLNKGIQNCTSDYIIFIDQDCVLHPEFISDHYKNRQPKTILAGRRLELSPSITQSITPEKIKQGYIQKNMWWIIPSIAIRKDNQSLKGIHIGNKNIRDFFNQKKRGVVGCNFSIHKEDLIRVNGFDMRYMGPGTGEDSDLEFRLNLNGVKTQSFIHAGVQYHLYHKLQKRLNSNEELFKKVKEEKVIATRTGLNLIPKVDAIEL